MIILDTCVVIWLAQEPKELSRAATDAVKAGRSVGGLGISCISLLEVASAIKRGRITVRPSAGAFLAEVERRFQVLPVTARIAQLAVELPDSYPGDPMDRLIGATALAHDGVLVTRDKAIRRSKAVTVVW